MKITPILLCFISSICFAQTMTNTKMVLTTEKELYNVLLLGMENSPGVNGSFNWPTNSGIVLEGIAGNQYIVEFKVTKLSTLPFVKNLFETTAVSRPIMLSQSGYVCCTQQNDWIKYTIDLSGYSRRTIAELEYSYGGTGVGSFEIHVGALTGPLLAKNTGLLSTGGWNTFKTIEIANDPKGILSSGKNDLYFVFPANQIGHGNFKTLTIK